MAGWVVGLVAGLGVGWVEGWVVVTLHKRQQNRHHDGIGRLSDSGGGGGSCHGVQALQQRAGAGSCVQYTVYQGLVGCWTPEWCVGQPTTNPSIDY